MAISNEARQEFTDRVAPLKTKIADLVKKDRADSSALAKDKSNFATKKIALCEQMIFIATLQMGINAISVDMLATKNNDALNDARKSLYKAVIYMEELVSNIVDAPFQDFDEYQQKLVGISLERRYYIIRKLGLAIDMVVEAFGDNSKWKESFVELRGRHAVISKNFVDMKETIKCAFDHDSPDYETATIFLRQIMPLLDECAEGYRDRYELASKRLDDMRIAVNLLIAERRIALAMGNKDLSETIKKKAASWKSKLEFDSKKGIAK